MVHNEFQSRVEEVNLCKQYIFDKKEQLWSINFTAKLFGFKITLLFYRIVETWETPTNAIFSNAIFLFHFNEVV